MTTPIRAAGFAWYRREHYARVLAIMANAAALPRSFDQWLKNAETGEQRLRAQGWIVHRIDLDPDQFLAWCARLNINADGKARSRFANEAVARKYGKMS